MTNKELNEKVEFNTEKVFEQQKRIAKLEKRIEELEEKLDGFIKFDFTALHNEVEQIKENKTTDVITPKSHKFKVGDRVQFKKYNGEIVVGTIRDICMDKATIEQKTEDGVGVYIMGEVHLGRLKPATDEPKCKFKVGDRVKVRCYGNATKCTITEINGNKATIFIDETTEFGGSTYSITEDITDLEPYTEPRWTFTDDEKVILRNLPEEYKWIARNKDGAVFISFSKPFKDEDEDIWDIDDYKYGEVRSSYIWQFNHLFQSIKWTDDEACEFRKFI